MSWLLRGDEPSLYRTDIFDNYLKYQSKTNYIDQWGKHAINRLNIRREDIRFIPEVREIYIMYHYDKMVRIKGTETKTFTLPDNYVSCISAVQKKMQRDIVRRGIAIETNPSSNMQISTLSHYFEHPIKTFYNIGLTLDHNEQKECPQINVSINTDDNGVFQTRLENEYALLACSMEQLKAEDGTSLYSKEQIYEWLDNIIKLGLSQGFGDITRQRSWVQPE